ncbi:STAS domain-containing protein [Streptomyces sp. BE20]|uniref:STAS domain-containing protein n=1 Tax=unclassified Streptomyces TaxID=2593676 RepID=UPI002E7A08D0|nr:MULTISPECIES: STAS domain-containing protein [unclassified Streptomyces]MED7950452.1 STAS domain-containing protein [Streptomyces sp. BE303]MEE1824337.1 STAS domain-containing protein [Streptomyces sp. BE20]
MSEHEPVFTVTTRDGLAGPVLECSGELDQDQTARLHRALRRALAARTAPPMLLVDLNAVTFMDSAGLTTLLRVRIEVASQGTEVHLARPSRQVAPLLEITGAGQIFPVDHQVPPARPAC